MSLWAWRDFVVRKRTASSRELIQKSIQEKDFVTARSALLAFVDPALRESKEREIRTAELKQGLLVRDYSLLRLALGDNDSDWIDPNLLESAELQLAREAVQLGQTDVYKKYSDKWFAKTAFSGQWILLQADYLLAAGKPEEALKYLKEATLTGPEDALRYARLALIEAKEPWKAIQTLDQGLSKDPKNAELLSFRAQIQEAGGRVQDARLDYVAAVLSDRKNPLHRDILANFYLRNGDLRAAAETWHGAAEETGLGLYAMKAWFWFRMSGTRPSTPIPSCPKDAWKDFVTALAGIPDHIFWDPSLESTLPLGAGTESRPEITWLRLLESIRNQDTGLALSRLNSGFPHSAEDLWPGLAVRLLANLSAIENQDPRSVLAGRIVPSVSDGAHTFLRKFHRWASSSGNETEHKEFETWLSQPESMAGTLLASGWPGAAMILANGNQYTSTKPLPDWLDYGYAKSLLHRDGKTQALLWLESLPSRGAAATLLMGEIQLTSNAITEGLATLEKITSMDSPYASRASWTLAFAALDRGDSVKARQIVNSNVQLAESVQGKEIIARAALAEGLREEAIQIYEGLGEQSGDAMVFLSKEAYARKDFEQARKWTAILARRHPERPEFRKNLIKIDELEKLDKP